jgi:hypothetical protein
MGAVLTSISTFKQALTGGAFEALAAVSGDTLSALFFSADGGAFVEEIVSGNSTQRMEVAVFSPRFGDNQFGYRAQHMFNPTQAAPVGPPQWLMPRVLDIPVFPSDVLNVQVNAPAGAGNANVCLQLYYQNVPGAGQRLASWRQIEAIGWVRVLGIEVTVTPGATGSPGTAVAINANDARLRANLDYALLGYLTDTSGLAFRLKGPDTSGFNILLPVSFDARNTADYFVQQDIMRSTSVGSMSEGPHIPVINSNNAGSTTLDGLAHNNPGATKVTLILAEMNTPVPV